MQVYAIYTVTNTLNGKMYVGLSKELSRRWSRHRNAQSKSSALHAAIRKHGVENFQFSHVSNAFGKQNAELIERLLIQEYDTMAPRGYNLTAGGSGLYGAPQETREKVSRSSKGRKLSDETKAKISAAGKNRKHTPETIQKMRDAKKGIKKSEDHKKKIGLSSKGRKHTEEAKQKISLAGLGRKVTEEIRANMVAAWARRKAEKELVK